MICQRRFVVPALVVAPCLVLVATGCGEPQPAAVKPVTPAVAPAESTSAVAPATGAAADDQGPAIAALIEKLAAAPDSKARVLVIDEIGAIGQNAKPALDALLGVLDDEEPRVRWHAARAIGLIGEDARSAIPALVGLLEDADPIVVTQAAAAVAVIREDDGREQMPAADAALYTAAIEPLSRTAVHADPRARRASLRALKRLTASPAQFAPILSKQLADADPSVVLAAMHSLADFGGDAVPFLLEALKDPASRYWATVALAEIGPDAAEATKPLVAIVEETDEEERLQAILALAGIGEKAAAAAPVVVKVLEANDESSRLAAAFALGRMRAAGCDECLERAAGGNDAFLAAMASWALARIHPEDEKLVAKAVERLKKGLANPDADMRAGCASGLSDLAADLDATAKEQLAAAFVDMLTDPEAKVGVAAGAALVRLGGAAVPALDAGLATPAILPAVLEIASAIGPPAKPLLPKLLSLLDDPDAAIREEAVVAIGALGGEAADAAPALGKLLGDAASSAGLRYASVYALGRIGPAAAAAEPLLRTLSTSDDELLATVATWATLKIKPGDATLFAAAVPLLRRALRDQSEMVRLEAAVALGDIGSSAASAIPILELVSEDDSVKQVRSAAAEAVAKIKAK
ncbi:MAG: HEAT repeat domain-containing protein [Pirellulales bacterium]